MRKRAFEKLLKEAIILEAEEQGARFDGLLNEPAPEEAQARFDAALNGSRTGERQTAGPAEPVENAKPVKRPPTRGARWLFGGATAVVAAALIFGVAALFVNGSRGASAPKAAEQPSEPTSAPHDAQPLEQPDNPVEPQEPTAPDEPEPGGIRAEDLVGVWTEWTPGVVDTDCQLTLRRDGTAKMVYRISLSGEQAVEGTYSVTDEIMLTIGRETMQAVYDPESDALLLFDSETSWVTLYRNPDPYMIEHWTESERELLPKKTAAMDDFAGVWKLERAETAFSSFDLSGLSGYLTIEGESIRYEIRLTGEDRSVSWVCYASDSVLIQRSSGYPVKAIIDPDTGLLKLFLGYPEQGLTAATPVLVFRKLSVYQWQGYNCLIPEGFVSAHESDREFLAATEQMNDRDLFLMAYELQSESNLAGWDSDVFSENHLKTLLGTIGAQADYADFTGVSSHTIADGIVCYHLYNQSQKTYACLAKVMSDGENCLVMAGMTLGEPGVDAFDSMVNAFIKQSSKKTDDSFEIKDLIGTWTMVDPPSSAQAYTFELVFESEEKVTLKVYLSEQSGDIAFSYIFENNTVHLYMESYEVYPDGSIMKEKQEYYLFVSGGVMTYDLETDSLLVPNDEGGQTRFIRKAE